jgi:hypothetical protein
MEGSVLDVGRYGSDDGLTKVLFWVFGANPTARTTKFANALARTAELPSG